MKFSHNFCFKLCLDSVKKQAIQNGINLENGVDIQKWQKMIDKDIEDSFKKLVKQQASKIKQNTYL